MQAGKQFPSPTEVSFDSLSRFFSMILCEKKGPFVCLWVCDINERKVKYTAEYYSGAQQKSAMPCDLLVAKDTFKMMPCNAI
jgi:hypothetical protein